MRRLRAAATPAAFFVGLALICASLIEFQRWPWLERRLALSDFEDDLLGGWIPDLETSANLLTPLMRDESAAWPWWPSIGPVVQAGLIGSGLIAFAGLALVVLGRRGKGGAVLLAGACSGAVLLALAGLDLRLLDRVGHGCGPASLPLHSPHVLASAGLFVAWVAALAAATWIVMQYQAGVPLRASALAAVGLALCMVGLTLIYARAAGANEADFRSPAPPAWPVGALVLLTSLGLLLSLLRPLYCSRFVSALFLVVGLVSSLPAIAIAHDEQLVLHKRVVYPSVCGCTGLDATVDPPPRLRSPH